MTPWFDPIWYAWIPGTALGTAVGIWGAAAGCLAPFGRARGFIYGSLFLLVAVSVVFLAAGIYALSVGQPYGIWYGLGFPGLLCPFILVPLAFVMRLRYQQADERRMQAKDLA